MTNNKANNFFSKFISKEDAQRYLPVFWGHGPFPAELETKLNALKLSNEEMIPMASGVPSKELFSVKNITINHTLQLGNENVSVPNENVNINTYHIGDDKFSKQQESEKHSYNSNVAIESVFEYSDNTYGSDSTIDLYNKLIDKFNYFKGNEVNRDNYDIVITSGTSASCFYLTQLLCDEDKTILIEEFTYPVIVANVSMTKGHLAPFNLNLNASVDNGQNPIDIAYLENLLTNWSKIYPNKPYPSVLYTIPIQNPTGLVQSLEHRQEVYDLCKKFNVLIIEDDPYGNILLTNQDKIEFEDKLEEFNFEKEHYLNTLSSAASYLSIDTEGIVIRCESASKIFAPGMRIGVIVANKFFIDRLKNIIDCSTREISGVSMTIFNECCYGMDSLLARQLGNNEIEHLDGWIQWCMNLSHRYKLRQETLINSLYKTKAYQKKLFTCIEPKFGMFLCIQLNLAKLKPELLRSRIDMEKGMQYMDYKLLENNVNAVVGSKLSLDPNHSFSKSGFIRVTVAQASDNKQLIEAGQKIGFAIEAFFNEYLTSNQEYNVLL
ncbi:hypothetical protein QEN19_003237 [Hanseniaspora menglaensis]